MRFKRILPLICLLICLFAMASVCASEDTGLELSADNEMGDNLQTIDENPALTAENNDESDSQILTDDQYTYSDLKRQINSEGNINITKGTYTYNNNDDDTIKITRSCVIDGNGAVIDMAGFNKRAFEVTVSGVTLKNLTIKNAKFNDKGGAVYFSSSGTVMDCSFTDNQATSGGAVYFEGEGTLRNCNFASNKATSGSNGAVGIIGEGIVENCDFTNNSASVDTGAIGINQGRIENCNFTNNSASGSYGAVWIQSGSIINCNFKNNRATGNNSKCGAVFMGVGNVESCNFIANSASTTGAIWLRYKSNVTNCNFTANMAISGNNGAIEFYEDGSVKNCNFENNSAYANTGAIGINQGPIENCNFTGNRAITGSFGAVWIENGNVRNCNFKNNRAMNKGGAIYVGYCSVESCNFIGNNATIGSAVYVNYDSAVTVSNTRLLNNRANAEELKVSKNDDSITITFTGKDNLLNGIYSKGGVKFNNVTYWGAAGIANTGSSTPARSYNEAGQNITVEIFDSNENLVDKVTLVTDNNGQVKYDLSKLSNDKYTCNAYHIEDCYYTYVEYKDMGDFNRLQKYINGADANSVLTLYRDYTFTTGLDESLADGIVIDKPITINGNGYTINALQKARIFKVTSYNVVLENIDFTNGTASKGGAIYFSLSGTIINCNFTGNKATDSKGGAVIFENSGIVTNCNFNDNSARLGGAVYFSGSGTVTNCNFTNNQATRYGSFGGAVYFWNTSNVTNCNFADNSAYQGGDIFSQYWSTADTCIFKTGSDTTFNIGIFPPILNVDNITTFYGSGEKLTFDLKTNSGIPVTNANISISVYYKNNDSWVANYNCLSSKEWTVDLPAGLYYAIFDTEYAKFQPIKRTIKIIPDIKFYANVTSITTNNKTVNITAKSNIPNEIIEGKLLFILPNANPITANYAGNGTWWAVHTFDEYTTYQVNATYIGLDNVTVNNATINITRADSTLTVGDIVSDYNSHGSTAVSFTGATGVNAIVVGQPDAKVNVVKNTVTISGLNTGEYTLSVTTIADNDHNNVTRNATITVNKARTEFTANPVTAVYNTNKDLVITLKDLNDQPVIGVNVTVDLNGDENYTTNANGQIRIATKGLAANTYKVAITFNGTENYVNSTGSTTVSIVKETTRIETKPLTTVYNVYKYLVIGLKDNNANPIRNVDAFITINGVTYQCRSDEKGDARLIIRLNPKTYTAKITFDNDNYMGFTQYVTVIVLKATPKITAKKKTFKATKKVKKYTVTLKDNKGKAINKAKLTIKIGKKTFNAKTNKKGKATFKIKKLNKGKYKAKITYKGNYLYKKATKKVKITVK